MNRIAEMRVARGMSRKELGDAIGVAQNTIRRYELGEMNVSLETLTSIAAALRCDPADLVVSGLSNIASDVEKADAPVGLPRLGDLIGSRGLRIYTVLSEVLAEAGIRMREQIVVDESREAIEKVKAGDAVLVKTVNPELLLLRQFVPPYLLVTNRWGSDNTCLKLNDKSLSLVLLGVVLRPENA